MISLAAFRFFFKRSQRTAHAPVKAGRRTGAASLLLGGLMVVAGFVLPNQPTDHVAGRPVEVRSEQRIVVMPGGEVYRYSCGGRNKDDRLFCPAADAWDALPRWPEPDSVKLEVVGHEIQGMTMDGLVVVDPVAEARATRFALVVLATALMIFGGLMLWLNRPSAVRRLNRKLDAYIDKSRLRRAPLNDTSASREP